MIAHPSVLQPESVACPHVRENLVNHTTAPVVCGAEALVGNLPPASVSVFLPLPPSANRMWRHFGKRTVLAPEYVTWLHHAKGLLDIEKAKPITGLFTVVITVPEKARCDLDNYCKPILDGMQKCGVIDNDRLAQTITLKRGDVPKGHCSVELRET